MKKILILLIILAGVTFAQPSSPIKALQDSITSYNTRIEARLKLSGGTMTGAVNFGDSKSITMGTGTDYLMSYDGSDMYMQGAGGLVLGTTDANYITFKTNGTTKWRITDNGDIHPITDNVYDIGGPTGNLVNDIYATNLRSTALYLGGDAVTATATELNLLDGVTASTAELNFVDGVSSNIQTQLGTKLDSTDLGAIVLDSIKADIRSFSATFQYPSESEELTLLRMPYDATVSSIYAVVRGETGCSVTTQISSGSDRTTGDTDLLVSGGVQLTLASYQSGASITVDTSDLTAGEWIWITTSAVTGTVYEFALTINYTKD